MKPWLLALVLTLMGSHSALAQSVDTPMHFTQKFSGDQSLRFNAAGTPLKVKGARMNYRIISNAAEWKKVWGYLYDSTVKVDFKNQVVVAVYKSPAKGSYDIIPTRVYNFQGKLNLGLDVVWNGKTGRSHPFLFLVVKRFKRLDAEENFIAPAGKEVKYP